MKKNFIFRVSFKTPFITYMKTLIAKLLTPEEERKKNGIKKESW